MKATLKFNLGSKQLSFDGEGDLKTVLKQFAFLTQMPTKCGACKSNEISFLFKSPKGNDYYGLSCQACGCENNFGQYKTGGFYHKNEWKKFSKNDNSGLPPFEEDF